jgi:hypothetical protein
MTAPLASVAEALDRIGIAGCICKRVSTVKVDDDVFWGRIDGSDAS